MTPKENLFLKEFFGRVTDQALDPAEDERYVPIYEREISSRDPIDVLARSIEWRPGSSVQLLSGFRGIGKSTELRRLRQRLQGSGYLIVLKDIENYVSTSEPVDVGTFLIAVCGAFSDALEDKELLGKDLGKRGFWERIVTFLTETKVELEEISLSAGVEVASAEIRAAIRHNPDFKEKLGKQMESRLTRLVQEAHGFIEDAVRAVKLKHGNGQEVVFIIDSLDHFRGTSSTADEVHAALEELFASHADKLSLPNLHMVYTIPPYLKVLYPNLGNLYTGGVKTLTTIKVTERESGARNEAGLAVLREIVSKRGDWTRLMTPAGLDQLLLASGGHLRDLMQLLAEVMRLAGTLPVQDSTIELAIAEIRNQFLPIAEDSARWLERVHLSHDASLPSSGRTHSLSVFLDTHMILCYLNGKEWYDIHPLIRDHVLEQVARLRREAAAEERAQGTGNGSKTADENPKPRHE